jgi:transposase
LIFNRKAAAERVGRSLSTIYRWEEAGLLIFTLDRVRESDLLAAEKRARDTRGRPRKKGK